MSMPAPARIHRRGRGWRGACRRAGMWALATQRSCRRWAASGGAHSAGGVRSARLVAPAGDCRASSSSAIAWS